MRMIILSILILLGATDAVMAKRVPTSPNTSIVNLIGEGKGTVTVRSNGFGKKDAPAREDAELRAMQAILFTGLPNAQKYGPLVDNRQASETAHAAFYNDFFGNKAYKKFISSSAPSGSLSKLKGDKEKSMPFDITVNLTALRRNLEQNGIIRKFGF